MDLPQGLPARKELEAEFILAADVATQMNHIAHAIVALITCQPTEVSASRLNLSQANCRFLMYQPVRDRRLSWR